MAAHTATHSGTASVDPLAVAKQMATPRATSGTNYRLAAPTAGATGNPLTANTVATFSSVNAGTKGNTLIMPVLMNYRSEQFTTEKLLLDCGAECYVCPRDCAPERPIETLPHDQTLKLVAVTREPVKLLCVLVRPLHPPEGTVHYLARFGLRHSLTSGQRG